MNDFVRICCENTKEEFNSKVLPITYEPRGILLSEGFAFCSLCRSLSVNMIIESGVYQGQSTKIWIRFFSRIPIISIDLRLRKIAIDLCKDIPNVQLVAGDSKVLLPKLLEQNSEKKIGIFIDGPKGESAIELLEKCLVFNNVVVVGMHDVHKISFEKENLTREILDEKGIVDLYTDDDEFVQKYSYMDNDENLLKKKETEEDVFWSPGRLNSKQFGVLRNLGSYGPTAAFVYKRG